MTSRIVKKPGGLEVWVDDEEQARAVKRLQELVSEDRPGKRLLGLLEEVGRQMDEKGMIGHGQGTSPIDEVRALLKELTRRVDHMEATLNHMRDRSDEIIGNVAAVIVELQAELKHLQEEDDDG